MRLLSILFVLTGTMLFASERGFFVGTGTTWSNVDHNAINDDLLSFKLFAGYEFNRFTGVEIGYNNLGTYGQMTDLIVEEPVLVSIKSQAWTGAFLLTLPSSDRFSLFTKLGVFYHEDKGFFVNPGGNYQKSEDAWDLLGGIGTRFSISDSVSLQGEWERLTAISEDLDCISLSIYFRF